MTTIKPCGLYSDRHRVNLYTFIIIHLNVYYINSL